MNYGALLILVIVGILLLVSVFLSDKNKNTFVCSNCGNKWRKENNKNKSLICPNCESPNIIKK